jgi:hypothetical protein
MLKYNAVQGQSIYDVCLNTYGSFDYLTKLLQDNNIESIDKPLFSGQILAWDETLTIDQVVNKISQNSNIIYATKILPNESMDTIVKGGSSEISVGGGNPAGVIGTGGSVPVATLPLYIGYVDDATPSEAAVKSMASRPATKEAQTFTYSVDTKRFCLSYPTYLGQVNSIKDTNGFEIKSGFATAVSNFTIDGQVQSYTTLTLIRKTTQNNFTITFIF